MVLEQAGPGGRRHPVPIEPDTLCIHGDAPQAATFATGSGPSSTRPESPFDVPLRSTGSRNFSAGSDLRGNDRCLSSRVSAVDSSNMASAERPTQSCSARRSAVCGETYALGRPLLEIDPLVDRQPLNDGAGSRAPFPPRPGAPTRVRPRSGCAALQPLARWRSPGRWCRRSRSDRLPRRARRGPRARTSCRSVAGAPVLSLRRLPHRARLVPCVPSSPTAAASSAESRATRPRRNTFSAPTSGATRAATAPPVKVSAIASVASPLGQLVQNHALEFLIVLGQDEVAEAFAHFLLDRCELATDVLHVRAAHGELGLELRVVGAEAELDAAVRRQRLHPGEHSVGTRLADP